MRTISDRQGKTLKGTFQRALVAAGGGAVAQHSTRVKDTALCKYGSSSEDHEASFAPTDVALEIDLLCGSPIITSMMAEMQGYQLAPLHADPVDVNEPLSERDGLLLAVESMDVVKAITQALANHHLDAAEKREIAREAEEAMRALRTVLRKIGARD